ncbi:glycosyltransferase family 39 protein [bacterium]|nr:glycosyltransferase family 39 protein [bacterium]
MTSVAPPNAGIVCSRAELLFALASTLLLAILFWLPRIVIDPLRHWDEAWYAEMSRDLYLSTDPFTIHWNGDVWFHKPPLYFWVTVAAYHLLGIHEASARLFSFVCGLATVGLITGWSARRWGPTWGISAGTLLLAWPDFGRYAIRGQMDVPIAFFLACQLALFLAGHQRGRWHLVAGFVFGLGLMTKGMAAGLAYLIQFAAMIVARDFRPLFQTSWWASGIIGVAMAVPWHWQQWHQHGDLFLHDYVNRHFTQFFEDIYPESNAPGAPATYYLDYLIRKRASWGIPLLLLAVGSTVGLIRQKRDAMFVLCWCWLLVPPILLSFAWAKWSWYLVPIYPAASLLAVECLAPKLTLSKQPLSIMLVSILLAVISGAVLSLTPATKEHESELRRIGPLVASYVPEQARVLTLQTESGRRSIYPVATCFYAQRKVQAVMSREELSARATDAGTALFALVHDSYLEELQQASRSSTPELLRYEMEEIARVNDVVFLRLVPGQVARSMKTEPN